MKEMFGLPGGRNFLLVLCLCMGAVLSAAVSVPVSVVGISSKSVRLDVELIMQKPELPRGCEVTSLAMLLNYSGIDADKKILAEQVKRDPTPYRNRKGKVHAGNPHYGFVGDMYSLENFGLGVYHGPIYKLARRYSSEAVDLTGCEFDEIYKTLDSGYPVWIITNCKFKPLDDGEFQTWYTPEGPMSVTYNEHSVVVTGYDGDYIYVNDPLYGQTRHEREPFIEAWYQMGQQAVACCPAKTRK